jgi:hypothetical protein
MVDAFAVQLGEKIGNAIVGFGVADWGSLLAMRTWGMEAEMEEVWRRSGSWFISNGQVQKSGSCSAGEKVRTT